MTATRRLFDADRLAAMFSHTGLTILAPVARLYAADNDQQLEQWPNEQGWQVFDKATAEVALQFRVDPETITYDETEDGDYFVAHGHRLAYLRTEWRVG